MREKGTTHLFDCHSPLANPFSVVFSVDQSFDSANNSELPLDMNRKWQAVSAITFLEMPVGEMKIA